MGQLIDRMQTGIKKGSQNIFEFTFRLVSGLVLGLTLTLVGQALMAYGNLSFWFVLILSTAVFMKLTQGWNAAKVFICDLILVLIGVVLRMYIMIAPGA